MVDVDTGHLVDRGHGASGATVFNGGVDHVPVGGEYLTRLRIGAFRDVHHQVTREGHHGHGVTVLGDMHKHHHVGAPGSVVLVTVFGVTGALTSVRAHDQDVQGALAHSGRTIRKVERAAVEVATEPQRSHSPDPENRDETENNQDHGDPARRGSVLTGTVVPARLLESDVFELVVLMERLLAGGGGVPGRRFT